MLVTQGLGVRDQREEVVLGDLDGARHPLRIGLCRGLEEVPEVRRRRRHVEFDVIGEQSFKKEAAHVALGSHDREATATAQQGWSVENDGRAVLVRRPRTDQNLRDMFRVPPPIKTSWKNHTVRAVGNQVYLRPPTETYEAFLVGHLRWQLGESWITAEAGKPVGARHCIVTWLDAWQSVPPPPGTQQGERFRFRPSGAVRDLVGLADDVYRVRHAGGVPKSLKARLKHRDQFQGARYELAVAGCLARMCFVIDWHDDKSATHCELTARHPSGEVIAVEAKSRHRPGVLHMAPTTAAKPQQADVERLYREALDQNPSDRSFAIFIDVNLPPEPGRIGLDKRWIQEVRAMLDKLPTPSPSNPDPYVLLCVTNLGGYWQQDLLASPPEVLVIRSQHARFPLKDVKLFDALRTTLGRYGAADEG